MFGHVFSPVALQPYAGIQQAGQEVGEKVHHHDQKTEEKGKPEQQEFVAGGGGVDEVLAHPGNLKDGLHDEGSANEGGEGRAEVGHCRQEAAPQGMLENNRDGSDSLGMGRPNEVLGEYLQDAPASQSGQVGG